MSVVCGYLDTISDFFRCILLYDTHCLHWSFKYNALNISDLKKWWHFHWGMQTSKNPSPSWQWPSHFEFVCYETGYIWNTRYGHILFRLPNSSRAMLIIFNIFYSRSRPDLGLQFINKNKATFIDFGEKKSHGYAYLTTYDYSPL
jgi:hypothetical protein